MLGMLCSPLLGRHLNAANILQKSDDAKSFKVKEKYRSFYVFCIQF